jgi:hypothetical protein
MAQVNLRVCLRDPTSAQEVRQWTGSVVCDRCGLGQKGIELLRLAHFVSLCVHAAPR